jgi:hypothetical protein
MQFPRRAVYTSTSIPAKITLETGGYFGHHQAEHLPDWAKDRLKQIQAE